MRVVTPSIDARGLRIALVVSRFNHLISIRLIDGAREALVDHGADPSDLVLHWVAGAFEIPQAARRLAESGEFDAIVTLGSVIRGGTPHFEYVAGEAARSCGQVAVQYRIPVAFGVLTTDTAEQALARAGGEAGNKGYEAADAAIRAADALAQLRKHHAST